MKSVDVLIIGAGPSGTVAAGILKKYGHQVEIVEKLVFPRFVIGESLLPRCMEAFEEAGFLEALNARGYQTKDGAKFVRIKNNQEEIYDINFADGFTPGKTWTWQVPREDFDTTLAKECIRMGVPVHFNTEVIGIEFFDDQSSLTTVKKQDGSIEQYKAKFIVDGSGYGRVIPKLFNLDQPSGLPSRETLFTHFVDKNRGQVTDEPNRITISIYDQDTWMWTIPFSNGNCSVGFVSYPEFFEKALGNNPEEKLRNLIKTYPPMQRRFHDCEMCFEPRTIKAWSSSTKKFYGNGFVLTGNVTEFLDPVFSSGVTLASVSSQNAAHLVHQFLIGKPVNWESDYQTVCEKGVNVFRTYVESWYNEDLINILYSPQQNEDVRRQITSVLAGYVWDEKNPFVSQHERYIPSLAKFLNR